MTESFDINQYKNGTFHFPSPNIDPKLKLTKDYAKRVSEAIMSYYVSDATAIPFSVLSWYDETRNYSDGKQNPQIYEEFFGTKETENSVADMQGLVSLDNKKRKGTGNLNKNIIGLAPRIMQSIMGAFEEADFDIKADTIDPDSTYEQEKKKAELYAKAQNIDFINQFKQNAGIPPDTTTKYPRDLDELELMEQLGEFKTGVSKAIEKLCKHTFQISDWKVIKRKLIKDIVDFNRCCIKEYYDEEEYKWKIRYVDVTRLIAQYSDHRDFSDSCFFAEPRFIQLAEIRNRLEKEGYSEETIKGAAYSMSGFSWDGSKANPLLGQWKDYNAQDTYGNWLYNHYKTLVLDIWWIENDTIYKTEKDSKWGYKYYTDQEFGKNINKPHERTVNTTIKKAYECKWVVGTDMIFDLKISPSQPKKKSNKRPYPPYHMYAGTEESITRRLIPVYDNFQITWLKLQNKLQEMHGEILMLDLTVLDKLVKTGDPMAIVKAIKNMKRTGVLAYRSLGINSKYGGGNVKPLDKLPSSMLEQINESIALFENNIRMIEMITGINPVALGQQPSGSEGLGTTQMALQNTSKILRPIIDNVFQLKKEAAEFQSEAIRLALRNDKKCYDAYMRVVGKNDVDALVKSEYEARELGIELSPMPTEQDKQRIYMQIEKALEAGRNNMPGISFDVALYLEEKLMSGANLSDVRLYLTNAIRKQTEEKAMRDQQNIQMQGQQNLQAVQAKLQGDQQNKILEGQIKMQTDNNNAKNLKDIESLKINHERYIKEQDIKLQNTQQNATEPQTAGA